MNEREVLELLRALMMYAASRSTPSGVRTLACLTDAVDFKLFELTSKAHAQPANEPLPLGHYRCTHHGCTLIDTPTSGHSHGHEGGTLMYAASEAQGEPPTIEECDAEFRRATVEEATRRLPSIRTEDAVEIHLAGISAVRALCLSRTPSPSPALAERLIDAAKRIDWKQVGLNGGGCFHLEDDGRFCLRAHHWAGHGGENPVHLYEPLYVAMTRIAKASDSSPALAAPSFEDVERAYDNAKEWDGRSWSREAGLRAVMALYARAALPKAVADAQGGGA